MVSKIDEQTDVVNVMTDRVRKRKQEYLREIVHMCPERSHLITQSWKETEGEPLEIRRAKGFKRILEAIPIAIHEGELIVGGQSQYVRGVQFDIEMCSPEQVRKVVADDRPVAVTVGGHAVIDETGRLSVLEDVKYWDGKTPRCLAEQMFRGLWGETWNDFCESGLITQNLLNSPSARSGDWGKVLTLGLNSIIAEAKERISQSKAFDETEVHQIYHWEAVIIACDAVINFSKRYAKLAREMAAEEKDEARRVELRKIAEACEWVPANPARNFYEALQSFFTCFLAFNHEAASRDEAPGRLDQYMYPFYKTDIDKGTITPQEAAELLGLLIVKFMEFAQWGSAQRRELSQGNQMINVTIGGVTKDGHDATNDLSFLVLEASRQVKQPQPHVTFRYHDGINPAFMIKAIEANRDHGAGIPAFFNDKAALLSLTQQGIPLSEAREWAPQGCIERTIPSSALVNAGVFYNLPKLLELALNNGLDPRTRKQIGLSTGDPRNFASFEELYEAFKKQVGSVVDKLITMHNMWFVIRQDNYNLPFTSALTPGCMESGKDLLAGGGTWSKKFLTALKPFGHQNTVNSLAAIKKLVYDEKKVSMDELLSTLATNFEGKARLHRMLLAAPKWGNDDDYVDDIMKDLFNWTREQVVRRKNPWGEPWHISRQGVTTHYVFGKVVGALPDGREAWVVLADGSMSAMRGTDTKGPTAVFNSASKVDHLGCEATLLNLKFDPRAFQSKEMISKLISLIKTYFDNYGHHVQFNMLSRETLLDAKAHPENYRDLVVRVAGFSAFFVDLAPEVQDEIIERTEHSL